MTINTALLLGLIMSLIVNVFTLWYIRGLIGRLTWVSQNISDLVQIINIYRTNLETVYKLEQFYGDEQIRSLLEHTISLLEILEEYKDVVVITEPMEYLEDESGNSTTGRTKCRERSLKRICTLHKYMKTQ